MAEFTDLFGNVSVPRTNDDWRHLDYRAADIFSPHAPIDEDQLFAGRTAILEGVIETIFQRGQHAIVFGERGVGKTSITNILRSRIFSQSKIFKIVKRNCTAADTFRSIWEKLLDEFIYDGEHKLSDLVDHKTDAYQLYKWITQDIAKNIHPVFIVDEYDRIKDEQSHTKMADTIKYFSDFSCNSTIIIVGVSRNVQGLFGGHPSIERAVRQIPMPYMSPSELKEIFGKRMPDLQMKMDGNIEDTIISLAQGLPGYTHLIGQNAVRHAIKRRSLTVEMQDLNASLDKSIETCDEKIKELYSRCVRSTKPQNQFKEALLACALAPIDSRGYFSTADVRPIFSKIMKKDLDIPYFARHINQFCEDERGPALIREGKPKSYQYRFADALLRPYIAIRGINAGMISLETVT